jgi:hypothetical protein
MSENPRAGESRLELERRQSHAAPRNGRGSSVVGPRMLGALGAVAEALFATDTGPPPRDRIDWLTAECEDFLSRAGSRSRLLVRLAVLAVSVLAPLLVLRFRPLRRLPLGERVRALRVLEASPVAGPLFAVKALLSLIYYEHPDAAREIGFDGECLRGTG